MKIDSRWMAAGVLLSLFLSGVAVGGLAVMAIGAGPSVDRSFRAPVERSRPPVEEGLVPGGGPPGPPGFAPRVVVRRLTRELELTAEQRDSVQAILERQRMRAAEALRELGPRLRTSVDSATSQIRSLLTPEQRERFDELGPRGRGLLGPPGREGPPSSEP